MELFWRILTPSLAAVLVGILFLTKRRIFARQEKFSCQHCGNINYYNTRQVCVGCHKTSDGQLLSQEEVKTILAGPENVQENRSLRNKILLLVFCTLGILCACFTILKLMGRSGS